MDFGQIQYQSSLIDIIYLCVVLGWQLEFYESYHKSDTNRHENSHD